ncbi:MAG: NAD-dependent epimerase/dehydratase family protein [Spirochaetes bacterium]|nr:NAD-dependent epimerase/dehydratase family protein [Spirochaetota bacterium]
MKKILITGGTGFIGSYLVRELTEKKSVHVRLFLRDTSNLKRLKDIKSKNIEYFKGDFHNFDDINKSLKGIDTFIHLAAILGRGKKDDYQAFNVEVSKKFLNFAIKNKVKKIIYLSTIAVMGGTEQAYIYKEDDDPRPRTLYGKSKWEVEQYITHLVEAFGMNATIIRAPAVYGPEDNFDRGFIRIIDLVARNKYLPVGNLKNLMSLIYIDNLVDAILTVSENQRANGRIYFVADREILTTGETYKIICKNLGVPGSRFCMPKHLILPVERSIELAAKIFKFIPWYPENYISDITSNYACSIKKINAELKWSPKISTQDGLEKTIQWYKSLYMTR